MRGIIFADESGPILWPGTIAVSKQLIPIYDKPMIYYPLSVLLVAGIRDILIISTPQDAPRFQELLGGGNQWGINFSYAVQPSPNGLAQAFIIGSEFIGNQESTLVLGDNIFYGSHLSDSIQNAADLKKGARIFACQVQDPKRYGVVSFNETWQAIDIEEKPLHPKSKYAVPGLYFYDNSVSERTRCLKPSERGELEITDLNRSYLEDGLLSTEVMSRGMVWLDIGTHDSLLDAAKFIETIEKRQGMKICCPEEICWRMGYIDNEHLLRLARELSKNDYGRYLKQLVE